MTSQIFPDPWSKIAAFLSPGMGYIVGQGLEVGLQWANIKSGKRKKKADLAQLEETIKLLQNERESAVRSGSKEAMVKVIDDAISVAQQKKIEVIAAR